MDQIENLAPSDGLAKSASSVFVGYGSELLAVDWAMVDAPAVQGRLPLDAVILDVVVKDQLAIVALGSSGLGVVDVSDPAAMELVGTWSSADAYAETLATTNDAILVADPDFGLRVIEVTGSVVEEVATVPLPLGATAVAADGSVALVAESEFSSFFDCSEALLHRIDLSDPQLPQLVGVTNLGEHYVDSLATDGAGLAFVGAIASCSFPVPHWVPLHARLLIADLVLDEVESTTTVEVDSLPLAVTSVDLAIDGNGVVHVAVTIEHEIYFLDFRYSGAVVSYDVAHTTQPSSLGSFEVPARLTGVVAEAEQLFVGTDWRGTHAIDVSDPAASVTTSIASGGGGYVWDVAAPLPWPDLPLRAMGIGQFGGNGFNGSLWLNLLPTTQVNQSVTLPASPRGSSYESPVGGPAPVGVVALGDSGVCGRGVCVDTPGSAEAVAAYGDYTLVAALDAGLRVVSLEEPVGEVSNLSLPGYAWDIEVHQDLAYVAAGDAGIVVVSLVDPLSPTVVGTIQTPGWARGLEYSEGLLWIADGAMGLRVVNAQTGDLVGSYPTVSRAFDVVIARGYAWVAADLEGLQVLDIQNPSSPTLVQLASVQGEVVDLDVGVRTLLAAGTGGVVVMKCEGDLLIDGFESGDTSGWSQP